MHIIQVLKFPCMKFSPIFKKIAFRGTTEEFKAYYF